MARCMKVLITFACVTSFSPFVAGLKLCELCSTGIACYQGERDPLKGQCAFSCKACTMAGYERCQNCQEDCLPLHTSDKCNDPLECCGSLGKQTTCEDKRCCTTLGCFCSSTADCCKGLHCAPSTNTCVSENVIKAPKLSNLFGANSPAAVSGSNDILEEDSEEHDTKFIEKIKETKAKLADMAHGNNDLIKFDGHDLLDDNLVDKIKSDTEKFIDILEADKADTDLIDILKIKTAKVANRVKLEKQDVVHKVRQGEKELVEAVKATTSDLTDTMKADAASFVGNLRVGRFDDKQGNNATMVYTAADDMDEKEQDLDGKRFKAKVDSILSVHKDKIGEIEENLEIEENEEIKTKMSDVLKVNDAVELRKRIDKTIKEDREKVRTKIDETNAKMDEAMKSVDEWTTTNLHFRNAMNTLSKLSDLDLCLETNIALVEESFNIQKLIKNVSYSFHDIKNSIPGAIDEARNIIREFVLPSRIELYQEDGPVFPRFEDVSESEEQAAEEPESLNEICKIVTVQLKKQVRQLTDILHSLSGMLDAVYTSDIKQFKTQVDSLFNFVSDILENAIEPADGTTPFIDWSAVLLSLNPLKNHLPFGSRDGDETETDDEIESEEDTASNVFEADTSSGAALLAVEDNDTDGATGSAETLPEPESTIGRRGNSDETIRD